MQNISPEATPLKKNSLLKRIWEAESYTFVLVLIIIYLRAPRSRSYKVIQ